MRVTKLRLVGMERERERIEPVAEHEGDDSEGQVAETLRMVAMMLLAMLIAGICGGIELGTIPFPL